MKILILGGTGPMGMYLVQQLRSGASEILVTSRQSRQAFGNVAFAQGDAKQLQFLRPLLEHGWDAIIDFMVYSTQDFKNKADLFLAATNQYCFLSSARVYANCEEPLTEQSPRLLDVCRDQAYLATDEYALAKARQEDCLFARDEKNWTIIRPYITYGPERLQLGVLEKEAWLYRALQGRTIIFSSDIACRKTTMTHGRDVAHAMAALIGNQAALGEAFHITGRDCLRWSAVLDLYVKHLAESGHHVRFKMVDVDSFIQCHGSSYQIVYDRLYDRVFDNTKIDQFVASADFMKIEMGLRECLFEFLDRPRFGEINWSMEGVKDRACGEFARCRSIKGVKKCLKYIKYRFL